MRELSLIVVFFITLFSTSSDSPHGDSLTISCDECHTSDGWEINRKDITFNHNITRFELVGLHQDVNCDACHPTLVFSDAETECAACHTDVHQQTVGFDCGRCHTSNSWLVENITEIHQQSRFPLLGAHMTSDCYDCHQSASLLTFEPLGVECVDCHSDDYYATTDPNHVESNFSTECMDCHQMDAFAWTGADFTHGFFPLTLGHDISNCTECHTDGNDYSTLSPDCISCHQDDFLVTTNPNHQQADLSTNCTECHTTNPGWKPADFQQHDNLYFPIYSGEHNGEWVNCTDCHTTPSNYSLFTCIDCHEHNQSDMDDEHNGVSGYLYNSNACFECHPTGSEDGAFNHNNSAFPLTGAHTTTDCASCHTDGYAGTPSNCSECHTPDFNEATNPNHIEIGLSNDCESCHTTNPGWEPASFDVHNDYYELAGAHTTIDCNTCHETQYSGTPNTCVGCHLDDYNQTTDPPHATAQFSTECLSCHTESAWEPSTFDHDNEYFPIYSGEHQGEWSSCIECHTTPSNYALFSCIDCHEHNQIDTDDEHDGLSGYLYNSNACFECHPTGSGEGAFNHNNSAFPLTGAHTTTDCASCHTDGYAGTPTNCSECHAPDFNETTNPNHVETGLSNDCESCHTTNPGWEPASFDVHNDYYVLSGAHVSIANDCYVCHEGNYNNTLNTCVDCHLDDYNQTTDPAHATAQFSTDCLLCHTENAWEPSTFDHDNQYFPIYSGEHQGEWSACYECHTTPSNYALFSCIDCHEHNKIDMDDEHNDVTGYVYNSNACFDCHPQGDEKHLYKTFKPKTDR